MSASESPLNRSDNLFYGAVGFHLVARYVPDMQDGAA